MSESHICVGGPLQGRSFTEPPAGYHRCALERGLHQGKRYVWEYDGTDCLDELLAAAVRYGKLADCDMVVRQIFEDRAAHHLDAEDLGRELDNAPFGECWRNGERLA